MRILSPAMPLFAQRPYLEDIDALEAKLRFVLETRPGRLPWRPEFGCDLSSLIGEPTSPQNLSRATFQVQRAIARWVPEVKIVRCTCRAQARPSSVPASGTAPPGEGALLSLGSQAVLLLQLELETAGGLLNLTTSLQP